MGDLLPVDAGVHRLLSLWHDREGCALSGVDVNTTVFCLLATTLCALPGDTVQGFQITDQDAFSIEGNPQTPLFYINRPFFREETIYLPSIFGNQVIIWDRQSAELRAVGRKGRGPGEFNLPYGVLADGSGQFYVNDRSNMRIQVFDSRFDFVRSVPLTGQCESFFVRDKAQGTFVQMVGTYPCRSGTCLIQTLDLASGTKRSFAPMESEPAVFSWVAAQNAANGHIVLANILEPRARVYDEAGALVRDLSLRSPDWVDVDVPRGDSESRQRAIMATLRTGTYTSIERLLIDGEHILVQLKRWRSGKPEHYRLQVFDQKGGLLMHGFESDDVLGDFRDQNTFWFYRVDEDTNENGTVHVTLRKLVRR